MAALRMKGFAFIGAGLCERAVISPQQLKRDRREHEPFTGDTFTQRNVAKPKYFALIKPLLSLNT